MANPQVENGHLKIASELLVALCRYPFTSNHLRLLLAIMAMTYQVGKTKAQIGVDDLRYATNLKRYKIESMLTELEGGNVIFRQVLNQNATILGIQKDFEKWGALSGKLPKMGNVYKYTAINTNSTNTIHSTLPKMGKIGSGPTTPPTRILGWVHRELAIPFKPGRWKREMGSSTKLYKIALDLAHGPVEAAISIKDYFAYLDNPDFRSRVSMPLTYMLEGYSRWYKQLPPKPRSIKADEEALGKRFRYNLRTRNWERA